MKNSMIIVYVLLFVSIITNIMICLYFKNKKKSDINHDSKVEAQLILLDRKLSEIQDSIYNVSSNINVSGAEGKPEAYEQADLLDMDVHEMAKKMNKSIKEVELMLKMRGLR